MQKSESIINLTKAVLNVMAEVKGIDKTMTIGEGKNSYKGVPDQQVKKIIGESMQKYGLCLLPIAIHPTLKIERWDGVDYNNKPTVKQSVFSEVQTTYLLLHESGEFIEISGYGHGVDSQDKSAGKATTYALKYALLYTFLIPTGKIDDADNIHSDDIEMPESFNQPFQDDQGKDKITTWLSEKEYKAIIAFLKSTKPEEVERGRKGYDKFMTPPFGMKKTYRDEIQLIIKDLDKEKQKRIENKLFDN